MHSHAEDILDSGKRDKMEIMAAIIAMAQKPSKITPIMAQVNLNHSMMKKYMKTMVRLNMIERHEAKDTERTSDFFQATERGLKFLETYCELLRFIYGEQYLSNDHNLAVACLQYCKT